MSAEDRVTTQDDRTLLTMWERIREHKVVQWTLAYGAAAYTLLHVAEMLSGALDWPHVVVRVTTLLLLLGLPVATTLAWYHGHRAQHRVSGPELVILTVLLAIAGSVLWFLGRPTHTGAPATPVATAVVPPVTVGPPSIAVLPFVDMSAEHDQQYLGDGIAEELLNALASIEGLNVAARTSSFSFAGKGARMKEIGDTLHVRHVLQGSVRRSGQKLRVTAQLIDVDSGFHLFSESYDREVKDIFEIQNEIAREIVGALLPRLGLKKEANLIKQGTTNLAAYNLRLQAHKTLTAMSYDTAMAGIRQLKQAIELDPSYGDAWGDLANIYGYMGLWAGDPAPLITKAASAAAVARVHSPNNVPALLTQALVSNLVDRDLAATAKIYEQTRAIGTDPSVWAVHKALFYYAPQGQYDEALATLSEARVKDPVGVTLNYTLVIMSVGAGRIDDALAATVSLDKLGSKAPGALAFPGWAFLRRGDVTRAREYLAQLHEIYGPDNWNAVLLQFGIDEATGNSRDARALLDRQLTRYEEGQYVSAYVIGEGYKALGAYDEAISWYTRAVEQHHPHAVVMMPLFNRNHPVIGKDPRFLALLRRMGLDGEQTAAG